MTIKKAAKGGGKPKGKKAISAKPNGKKTKPKRVRRIVARPIPQDGASLMIEKGLDAAIEHVRAKRIHHPVLNPLSDEERR